MISPKAAIGGAFFLGRFIRTPVIRQYVEKRLVFAAMSLAHPATTLSKTSSKRLTAPSTSFSLSKPNKPIRKDL